jgi:hypothetical protein
MFMIMHGVHKFMGSMSPKTLNYAKVLQKISLIPCFLIVRLPCHYGKIFMKIKRILL